MKLIQNKLKLKNQNSQSDDRILLLTKLSASEA